MFKGGLYGTQPQPLPHLTAGAILYPNTERMDRMEKQFLTDLGIADDISAEITVAALLQKYDGAYTILSCENN